MYIKILYVYVSLLFSHRDFKVLVINVCGYSVSTPYNTYTYQYSFLMYKSLCEMNVSKRERERKDNFVSFHSENNVL